MTRFTFILVALFLAFNVSYAQSHSDLKGPAAKNYKPWKEQARTSVLMAKVVDTTEKGPAFKNKKAWKTDADQVEINTTLRERKRVTGPEAKNRKPWKSNLFQIVIR